VRSWMYRSIGIQALCSTRMALQGILLLVTADHRMLRQPVAHLRTYARQGT
jgi:hypothetical protein